MQDANRNFEGNDGVFISMISNALGMFILGQGNVKVMVLLAMSMMGTVEGTASCSR